MNNRFVKNNIGLLTVTGLCALVALVVLVFLVIYSIEMGDNISKLGELRGKISAINTKRPVPVEENKQPIIDDIEVYRKAAGKLQKLFGRPLEPAVDRFFETLVLKKSMWIPDGIGENDDVIRRMAELAGESQAAMMGKPQFPTLHNAAFDRNLDLISAEALVKRVRELSSNEDKAKVAAMFPNAETLGDEDLAKKVFASAELNKILQRAVPVADLAKMIRTLPADDETAVNIGVLFPNAVSAGDADMAGKIAAAAELDELLAKSGSADELARRIKELPGDDAAVKCIAKLISNAGALSAENLAKRMTAFAGLETKLRELFVARELARAFKSLPANDATAEAVRTLLPGADKLSEAELAKNIVVVAKFDRNLRSMIPDSDPDTLKKLREIPSKMTAEKFIEAFNARVLNNNENDNNFADRRTRFDDFRRDQFENWSVAREAFIAAAENRKSGGAPGKNDPCIVEKLDADNADDVLLAALGVPRRMNGDAAYLKRVVDNILGQLIKEYQIQIVGRAQGLGIVSSPEGGSTDGGGSDLKSINPGDYPAVATHLDIVSYMLYRLGGANVVIWDVQIRLKNAEGSDGFGGGKAFKDSFEQRDGYNIYHYTLEISGTMAEIRDALARLDDCYAVRRVYVVKNIALYAETNIADSIFTGRLAERSSVTAQTASVAPAAVGGRRRRPRSSGGDSDGMSENVEDPDAKRKEQEKLDREYEERQKKLDPDKRDGYGEPITAARGEKETFRAVIDVEYVVKSDR